MTRSKLRIALVAPLFESVPPALYGGTERVVSYLAEELVAQGHEVTLFASGDSRTRAQLISPCERALRLDPRNPEPVSLHVAMIEQVFFVPTHTFVRSDLAEPYEIQAADWVAPAGRRLRPSPMRAQPPPFRLGSQRMGPRGFIGRGW
jgi:glycosyltransferase involved in cell wall biosynthesis